MIGGLAKGYFLIGGLAKGYFYDRGAGERFFKAEASEAVAWEVAHAADVAAEERVARAESSAAAARRELEEATRAWDLRQGELQLQVGTAELARRREQETARAQEELAKAAALRFWQRPQKNGVRPGEDWYLCGRCWRWDLDGGPSACTCDQATSDLRQTAASVVGFEPGWHFACEGCGRFACSCMQTPQ